MFDNMWIFKIHSLIMRIYKIINKTTDVINILSHVYNKIDEKLIVNVNL